MIIKRTDVPTNTTVIINQNNLLNQYNNAIIYLKILTISIIVLFYFIIKLIVTLQNFYILHRRLGYQLLILFLRITQLFFLSFFFISLF